MSREEINAVETQSRAIQESIRELNILIRRAKRCDAARHVLGGLRAAETVAHSIQEALDNLQFLIDKQYWQSCA